MNSTADNLGGRSRRIGWEWPASRPLAQSITATGGGTGLLSMVEHSLGEQYLDSTRAGKMLAAPLRDGGSAGLRIEHGRAQSATMPNIERMAPGFVRLTFPPSTHRDPSAAGPARTHEIVLAGLAARVWENPAQIGVLSAYCPASWHHPRGVRKVIRRIEPRLPEVAGMLFVTLTFKRELFADAASAFEHGRPLIRKMMAKLRRGVEWQGETYKLDAAYCVKVEFHEDDWAHFHLIVLKRRFLPGELLNHLWGLGRCNVQRINNRRFRYLLKYVTKGGDYPEWVKSRKRLRVFQPSHGFMLPEKKREIEENETDVSAISPARCRKRASYTIGERLDRWARMGLLRRGSRFETVQLRAPFQLIFDQQIHSIAEDKKYLGNGFIKLDETGDILPWISNPLLN